MSAKDAQPSTQQFKLRWVSITSDLFLYYAHQKYSYFYPCYRFQEMPVIGGYNDALGIKNFAIQPFAVIPSNFSPYLFLRV